MFDHTTFLETHLPLATQVCQKTVKSAKCTVSTKLCGPGDCVKVTTVVKDFLYSSVEETATGKPKKPSPCEEPETIGWFECVCDKKKLQDFITHSCICKTKGIRMKTCSEDETSSDEPTTKDNSESETLSDECEDRPSTSKGFGKSQH